MENNLELNDNERGLFKLSGITGMLIAVVLLLSILGCLTYSAIVVQQNESTNYYKINQELGGLKANDFNNHKEYNLVTAQTKE